MLVLRHKPSDKPQGLVRTEELCIYLPESGMSPRLFIKAAILVSLAEYQNGRFRYRWSRSDGVDCPSRTWPLTVKYGTGES